jgi:hypothetical protein
MKTTDFRKTVTSSLVKENLNKMFGLNVNLENYSREQLEDFRNKLRTRLFQQEGSAGINDLLTNETYQKDKAMLELLNTRIKEMLGEDIKKLRDKMIELSEGKKGVRDVKHTKKAKGTDRTGDGKSNFDDVQVARMTAGGVPKKTAIAKATSDKFTEAAKGKCCCKDKGKDKCPVHGKMDEAMIDKVAQRQAKKIAQRTAKHEPGHTGGVKGKWPGSDKKAENPGGNDAPKGGKAPTGDIFGRTTGEVPTGNNGTQYRDGQKTKEDVEEAAERKAKVKPSAGMTAQEKSAAVKQAKSGKDMGKPGKGFKKIEKAAGGGKKGKKIAGAAFWKGQAKKESVEIFKRNVRIVNESLAYLIQEDEEGKAKAITAAGDIVNDYTSWMQRVGQYQTKSMIELADSIRADFGVTEAETFKQSVGPALAATLETLTAQREAISNAVAVLAGEQMPAGEPMGAEPPAAPAEPGMDMAAPDEMNPAPAGDEFAASDAAAGAGTPGREMRESRFARKLAESHSIMSKLAR